MIDFDNCGTVGYVCPSNYTSCSVGVCSSAPKVQLRNSTSIWTASINGSVDDKYFSTKLPFNVTLYSTTTDNISVTTNGVSSLSFFVFLLRLVLHIGALSGFMQRSIHRNNAAHRRVRRRHRLRILGRSVRLLWNIARHLSSNRRHCTKSNASLRILLQSLQLFE